MEIIKREIEITFWYLFENEKHELFLYYLEMGLIRKYAYEMCKK